MERSEQINRLREKTGVSEADAREALDRSGGDLLDALYWLEQNGKIPGSGARSTTHTETAGAHEEKQETEFSLNGFEKGLRSLWDGLTELFRMSVRNELVMTNRQGKKEFGLPVLAVIVLAVALFWLAVCAVVVALFCGCRFSFQGPDLGTKPINDAMGKATEFAETIKDEFSDRTEGK